MFIDVSRTLSPESVVFPGDASLKFVRLAEIEGGNHFAKIGIEGFTGHVMTHVDVPRHLFQDGKTLDDYEVDDFVFDAVVHEVAEDVIDRDVVAQLPDANGCAVLLKTRGSDFGDNDPFTDDFVYITSDGADALVAAGVSAVGIDYLSIDSTTDHAAHHKLMGNDVLVFEALQLKDAAPGRYELFGFPLKIRGGDGSCVRAVLRTL